MQALAPPVTEGLPIVGCMFETMGDSRGYLIRQFRKLGPIFRIKSMHVNYVVLAGPSANQFANTEGRDFFTSKNFWRGMLTELDAPNFLIGLDGEDHLQLRKMFKAEFSKGALAPHVETIHQLCVDLFADLKPGEAIPVVDPILQLTSQMVGCIMTGKIPSHQELKSFLYYVNDITNHFSLRRLPAWLLKFRSKGFKEAKAMTMDFADAVVAERINGNHPIHNFADAVIEASQSCPHLFTDGDVRFSAILPLFAGIDTLGQTLNYALYELHKNPEILAQTQAEIDAVFSQGVPNLEQLKEMEVLNSVIMETLRLHPSAFGMVRTATQDFVFEGHQVKKGEDVVILTTASHFMDEYFKEPEKFDISRFSAPRFEHRKRNVFAPFGRGPHTCLGAGMAESLMGLALGSILYHYEFEPLDPNIKLRERMSPTPSLGKHFVLQLKSVRR